MPSRSAWRPRTRTEIVETGLALSPTFGAICLDDISAPRAFTIADHLENGADIPVFSNQHHGTAILVLGGLHQRAEGRRQGARGRQGRHLRRRRRRHRRRASAHPGRGARSRRLRPRRRDSQLPARAHELGQGLPRQGDEPRGPPRHPGARCCAGADVFIGLSTGGIVSEEMVRSMAPDPIVFALAVPEPEISPAAARAAGAKVVATGRSDFPNTMDVSLVFPGVFRGLLDSRARNIRLRTLLYAAQALADDHPAGRAPRRLHRAPHLRFPGRPGDRGGGRARRAEAGEAGRDDRAGAGQRAHPPLRLRGAVAAARNRPPAASTRPSARRRSTCGCATAACWRSAPRSRSATTTS